MSKDIKSVRGKNVWTNGTHAKSYAVQNIGSSFKFAIKTRDENGKVTNIERAGFKSELEAKNAAEDMLNELFGDSSVVLRSVK